MVHIAGAVHNYADVCVETHAQDAGAVDELVSDTASDAVADLLHSVVNECIV